MPHITVKELAKGLVNTLSKADRLKIQDHLIVSGTSAAVNTASQLAEKQTGLPRSCCTPVAKQIVKDLRKQIRVAFSS